LSAVVKEADVGATWLMDPTIGIEVYVTKRLGPGVAALEVKKQFLVN
jgi:hypothetical protein